MADYGPGDVVRVSLDPSVGREQQKTRPCLVVSDMNPLGLVIVLPITDAGNKRGTLFVPIFVADMAKAGLSKPSVVDTFQIRCIDRQRIKAKLGTVGDDVMSKVRSAMADVLGIDDEHVKE